MSHNQEKPSIETTESIKTESRRNFLKKAGAVALYTPPAIAMLMQPTQASIMKSPGGKQHKNHGFMRDNKRPE